MAIPPFNLNHTDSPVCSAFHGSIVLCRIPIRAISFCIKSNPDTLYIAGHETLLPYYIFFCRIAIRITERQNITMFFFLLYRAALFMIENGY